jgi:ATP-dependent protease HslVU (ClpYQ) peptidase subunit
MTTIAYRDGILAADGRVSDGHLIITDTCKKISRLSDGSLFALAGDDVQELRLIEWLEDGEDGLPPQGKDFTAILVDTDGLLHTFAGVGDRFVPWYDTAFAAFGSGADIAYGAMEMGASAESAVRCAMRRNTTTGGEVQIEVPGNPEPEEDEDQ